MTTLYEGGTMNSSALQPYTITLTVTPEDTNTRIDKFLAYHYPHYSRTLFKRLLNDGQVTLNNRPITKGSTLLKPGDTISVSITPTHLQKDPTIIADDLKKYPITIVNETDDLLVLNKPAGLLVHNSTIDPTSTTLVDWILHNRPAIRHVGDAERPGIVHRLDRNTSGIILVAKTKDAYKKLIALFKARKIHKTYLALVKGHPNTTGEISSPIGRHPTQRHKMTTYKSLQIKMSGPTIRDAITQYKVLRYFHDSSLVEVYPLTGRTHQIRVHFASIGHPILGDESYGKQSNYIPRQALHAYAIDFAFNGKQVYAQCNPPSDFSAAQQQLSQY